MKLFLSWLDMFIIWGAINAAFRIFLILSARSKWKDAVTLKDADAALAIVLFGVLSLFVVVIVSAIINLR